MIKNLQLVLVLALCGFGLTACGDDIEKIGATVTGIDYISTNYISVQRFSINGSDMGRAGKGGGNICCTVLPEKWHSGLTVKITWNETNWRDCIGHNYEAVVPVERYDEVGHFYVAFFANQKVKVVVSDYFPEGARMPGSKFPIKAKIPQKKPWDRWPPDEHCPQLYD